MWGCRLACRDAAAARCWPTGGIQRHIINRSPACSTTARVHACAPYCWLPAAASATATTCWASTSASRLLSGEELSLATSSPSL